MCRTMLFGLEQSVVVRFLARVVTLCLYLSFSASNESLLAQTGSRSPTGQVSGQPTDQDFEPPSQQRQRRQVNQNAPSGERTRGAAQQNLRPAPANQQVPTQQFVPVQGQPPQPGQPAQQFVPVQAIPGAAPGQVFIPVAAPVAQQQAVEDPKDFPTKFAFFAGLGLGFKILQSENKQNELNKAGLEYGIFLTGLYSTPRRTLELGLGWNQHRIQKTESAPNEDLLIDDEVRSQFLTLEAILGFNIGDNWALGPLVFTSFGSDTTHSPDAQASNTRPQMWLGASLSYFNWDPQFSDRYRIDFFTDVSIPNRQIFMLGGKVQFGTQFKRPVKVVEKEKVKVKVVEKEKIKVVEKEKVKVKYRSKILIDAGFVNFVTGRFDINQPMQRFLREVAAVLTESPDAWIGVYLRSHTDYRGGEEYNRKLSKNRARAVQRILVSAGVPSKKIVGRSLASKDPVTTVKGDQVALARNRRVEILIVGNQGVLQIKRKLTLIRQKYRMPETCGDGLCR